MYLIDFSCDLLSRLLSVRQDTMTSREIKGLDYEQEICELDLSFRCQYSYSKNGFSSQNMTRATVFLFVSVLHIDGSWYYDYKFYKSIAKSLPTLRKLLVLMKRKKMITIFFHISNRISHLNNQHGKIRNDNLIFKACSCFYQGLQLAVYERKQLCCHKSMFYFSFIIITIL